MAQRRVQTALAKLPAVSASFARVGQATSLARAAAASAARAGLASDDLLAGARVERAEKLLVIARESLRSAIESLSAMTDALTAPAEAGDRPSKTSKRRWDTPPDGWWDGHRVTLEADMVAVRAAAVRLEADWARPAAGGEYAKLVAKMQEGADGVVGMWEKAVRDSFGWREIADAVGDGLPSSHSVARQLHV